MGSLSVGQHFHFLLKSMKAKRCLEIGSCFGFITLTMAMAIDDGEVISLGKYRVNDDVKQTWKDSGHGHKVLI